MMNQNNTNTLPVVSVIMPAYNVEQYVEEAIRSVMGQTFRNWELFVIDDCSADATASVAERVAREDSRVTVVRNEQNMGVAKSRNRGLDLCRGSYIALLDSDDAWMPEKLEKQLARITGTGADLVYTSYAIVDADGDRVTADYIVPEATTFESLLRENTIGCSTVLLTRETAEKFRFGSDFYHEDYVLWASILKSGGKAAGCREPLVRWRYIENSRSFNKRHAAMNRWRIYRKYLKLPLGKCISSFLGYAVAGVRKYYRRPEA